MLGDAVELGSKGIFLVEVAFKPSEHKGNKRSNRR